MSINGSPITKYDLCVKNADLESTFLSGVSSLLS